MRLVYHNMRACLVSCIRPIASTIRDSRIRRMYIMYKNVLARLPCVESCVKMYCDTRALTVLSNFWFLMRAKYVLSDCQDDDASGVFMPIMAYRCFWKSSPCVGLDM